MKRIITTCLLGIALGGAFSLSAQQAPPSVPRCGYELVWKNLERAHPGFREQYDEHLIKAAKSTALKPTGTVYRIPVVFHVVYYRSANGDTIKGNIADSVLLNQLAVLNGAYRKSHSDTGNLRTIFKPLSADAEIEFFLAEKDPSGAATSGITRTTTTINGFGDLTGLSTGDLSSIERIKYTAQGGYDAWPTSRYLNIWVADMSINFMGQSFPAILGIATPPLNPLPPNWGTDTTGIGSLKDGVILQYHCVGNNNPFISELASFGAGTAGRTAVHEVGHYLGLRHIWGDPASTAQACTPQGSDGIDDTPDQATQSDMTLSPHPPVDQNTCHAGQPGDLPDLWENYMDYSKDNAQSMFTHGQVALMRSICANQRDSLTETSGTPTAIYNKNRQDAPKIYPQPAATAIHIEAVAAIDQVMLTDVLGKKVMALQGNGTRKMDVNVDRLAPGMYFLQLRSAEKSYQQQVLIRR